MFESSVLIPTEGRFRNIFEILKNTFETICFCEGERP